MNIEAVERELAHNLISIQSENKVTLARFDDPFTHYPEILTTPPLFIPKTTDMGFVVSEHKYDRDAPLCRYYANLGSLPAEVVNLFAQLIVRAPFLCEARYLVPIPSGGPPYAEAIAKLTGKKILNLFEKRGEGMQRRIVVKEDVRMGDPGENVVFIEDVVRKAVNTRREALPLAQSMRYPVVGVIAALDREEGGEAVIRQAGLDFYAGVKISQIWKTLLEDNLLTTRQFDWVKAE